MLRLDFGRPWRQTEGLLRSIVQILCLELPVPDYTTLARRSARLSLATALVKPNGPVTVVIDSSGLKIVGAGVWQLEKHGGKVRRSWRKLHIAVDPDSGNILAAELTTTEDGDASQVGPLLNQIPGPVTVFLADGAYDGDPVYHAVADRHPNAAVIIPPRGTAVPGKTAEIAPTQRDHHIQQIAEKGRMSWQRATGYGRRALVETAFFR